VLRRTAEQAQITFLPHLPAKLSKNAYIGERPSFRLSEPGSMGRHTEQPGKSKWDIGGCKKTSSADDGGSESAIGPSNEMFHILTEFTKSKNFIFDNNSLLYKVLHPL